MQVILTGIQATENILQIYTNNGGAFTNFYENNDIFENLKFNSINPLKSFCLNKFDQNIKIQPLGLSSLIPKYI